MIKRIWSFLGSIRFVIPLLILITLVSLVGIVVPQGQTHAFYASRMGAGRSAVIFAAGLDHVFSTWWFYGLLGMLSVNILVCSLGRLHQNVSRTMSAPFLTGTDAIRQLRDNAAFHAKTAPGDAIGSITSLLHRRLHNTRVQTNADGSVQLSAQSGLMKDIGSFLFHLGMVVLFAGGLWGKMGGFTYNVQISGGETTLIQSTGFLLHCDRFSLDRNTDGQISAYRSDLSILSTADSSVLVRKEIRVNDPLSHGGVRFYQSSYGESGTAMEECVLMLGGVGGARDEQIRLRPGIESRLEQDTSVRVLAVRFVTDFIIDLETKAVSSRSSQGENPAVRVLMFRDGDTLFQRWVFANRDVPSSADFPWNIRLVDYKPAYYTGIQVVKNPGVAVIWVGIIVMTIGVVLMFYVSRRKLWVCAVPTGTGSVLTVGGSSNRPADLFAAEFKRICDRMKGVAG